MVVSRNAGITFPAMIQNLPLVRHWRVPIVNFNGPSLLSFAFTPGQSETCCLFRHLILATLLPLVLNPIARAADTTAFRCPSFDGDYLMEMELLRHAPSRARRVDNRRIEVAWRGGKRAFRDKPPYDEPLSGVRWVYCGYDPGLRLHLISKHENSLFTGVLLDDRTGSLLPGGDNVLFSPDQRYYLTFEMEDGDVTELLKLYSRSGELLWSGHNGLTSAPDGALLATFQNLHWDATDRVLTVAVASDGIKPFTVTLAPRGDGKWYWTPLPAKIDGFPVDPGRSARK
jgi:hypothetical protein